MVKLTLLDTASAVLISLMACNGSTGTFAFIRSAVLMSIKVAFEPSSISGKILTFPLDPSICISIIFKKDCFLLTIHVEVMTSIISGFQLSGFLSI